MTFSLRFFCFDFLKLKAVQSAEHMLAMGTFGLLQLYVGVNWLRNHLGAELFRTVYRFTFLVGVITLATVLIIGHLTGYISPWTGRFWTLLDPTYAKEHIPIIASVSEHQVPHLFHHSFHSNFYSIIHILSVV
jgi:dolichyl-diphosphooligosaccharide--protein glycosyltransferase